MSGSFAKVPAEVLATGNGYAIAVYAAIAQHGNKDGEAFPSIARIQEITGWSRPTIDKAIRVLCGAGALVKTNRATNGMKRSNAYALTLDSRSKGQQPQAQQTPNEQIETTLPTMVTTFTPDGNHVTVGTKPRYHELEVLEPEDSEQESPQPPTGDGFDVFWAAYPKKVGKKTVQSWWERHKPTGELQAEMMAALVWQCTSPGWIKSNGQYIPNPMTWLNQGRWEDERPPTPTETSGGWQVIEGGQFAGYDPLRSLTPGAHADYLQQLERAKREAERAERERRAS